MSELEKLKEQLAAAKREINDLNLRVDNLSYLLKKELKAPKEMPVSGTLSKIKHV